MTKKLSTIFVTNILLIHFLILSYILSPFCHAATIETIVPGGDWIDTDGTIVNVTEGGFLQVGDTFYLWGLDRSADNYEFEAVNCYSSTDMKNWKFENNILKKTAHKDINNRAVVERAKILHNEKTGQFVMWMHFEGHNAYSVAEVAYATSSSITGNFTFHEHFRPMNIDSRDMNVYRDDDGKAYLICSTNTNSRVRLFLLDDTYTKIVKEIYCGYASDDMECEGHGIIHTEGRYYWMMSWCTGWDFNDNHYFHAASLEGPWTRGGTIAVTNTHTYESQIGFSFTLRGSKQKAFIFMGDRWSTRNFGKTRLVLLPIATNGTSLNVPWYDEWDLNAKTGEWYPCARKFIDGVYTITAKHSNKVLGIKNGANDIVQQQPDGSGNQLWRIENRGASHFRITSVGSGKSFDVSDESRKAGAKVLQWEWKDTYNQKWHIVDCNNGYHRFISVNTLGKTLEIQRGSTASGTNAVLGDFQYKDYQMFQLTAVNDDVVSGDQYQIINRASGESMSTSAQETISMSTTAPNVQQVWTLVDCHNSYYTITNLQSGKALDNRNARDDTPLIASDSTGSVTQQWQLCKADDGYYKLINRMSGNIAAFTGDNQIIQVDDKEKTESNGQWKFKRVDAIANTHGSRSLIVRNTFKNNKFRYLYNVKGQKVQSLPLQSHRRSCLPIGIYIMRDLHGGNITAYLNN